MLVNIPDDIQTSVIVTFLSRIDLSSVVRCCKTLDALYLKYLVLRNNWKMRELRKTSSRVRTFITEITDGDYWSLSLSIPLPPNLLKLDLGQLNCPLSDRILPQTLLEFRAPMFDQMLVFDDIPPGLTSLDIGMFQHHLPDKLPKSLQSIRLGRCAYAWEIPMNVQKLSLPGSLGSLASLKNLHSLELRWHNTLLVPHQINYTLQELSLPAMLSGLIPESLPPGLKVLDIRSYDSLILPNTLPDTIIKLTIGNVPLPFVLPPKLISLNARNPDILQRSCTSSLKFLCLTRFNSCLQENSIPASVTSLLMPHFNQELEKNVLPASLTRLGIPSMKKVIQQDVLPKSLRFLNLLRYKKRPPEGKYDVMIARGHNQRKWY